MNGDAEHAHERAEACVALDLGSTRIKCASVRASGRPPQVASVAAPIAKGVELVRESDPHAWTGATRSALAELGVAPNDPRPFAVSTQRSSFLLFERATGRPRTALISWQDRRAEPWCDRHGELDAVLRDRAGLVLSPHYVGPKLAQIFELDRSLRHGFEHGELALATLDGWIALSVFGCAEPAIDATLAARTGLFAPERLAWDPALCAAFGVAIERLPRVEATSQASRRPFRVQIADQAASTIAAIGDDRARALVNLGTGSFVLAPTGGRFERRAGYLAGPLLARADGARSFALEATINGGGAMLDRISAEPSVFDGRDRAPDAFAAPDENGVGAPHWLAARTTSFNAAALALAPRDRRRVALEGLVFRIADALSEIAPAREVHLAGGLARDAEVARALAALLARPVRVIAEFEASLLGAAQLALDHPRREPRVDVVDPDPTLDWLGAKRERWRAWYARWLADPNAA